MVRFPYRDGDICNKMENDFDLEEERRNKDEELKRIKPLEEDPV